MFYHCVVRIIPRPQDGCCGGSAPTTPADCLILVMKKENHTAMSMDGLTMPSCAPPSLHQDVENGVPVNLPTGERGGTQGGFVTQEDLEGHYSYSIVVQEAWLIPLLRRACAHFQHDWTLHFVPKSSINCEKILLQINHGSITFALWQDPLLSPSSASAAPLPMSDDRIDTTETSPRRLSMKCSWSCHLHCRRASSLSSHALPGQ